MKPIKHRSAPVLPTAAPGSVALGVIFRDNIATIKPFLESIRGHFDFYAFVDTGAKDGTRRHIDAFLKSNPGEVRDFEWCDDFAKARNVSREMSLSAKPKPKWFMFLDTDDVLHQGEKIRGCLKSAEKNASISMIFVPYRYDVDENLNTMRICPNTRDWMFQDAIHERLTCTSDAGPAQENYGSVNEFFVWHKRKTGEEKEKALRRNAAIAEREYASATDPAYKARLARTIAMIPKIEGRHGEAIPFLEEVGNYYPQLPEGKQAFSEVARFHAAKGDFDTALTFAKKAGPSYEAMILSGMHRYDEVIERQTVGHYLGEQTTHEGFLFEKVVAPAALADAAYQTKKAPAQMERAINNIRGDLRGHVAIAPVVQQIRHHIDRITIVCWMPDMPAKQKAQLLDRLIDVGALEIGG